MAIGEHVYDTVIIGGGPAGYSAALYATRAGLETVLLERLAAGGQLALTHRIDNYPGFPEGIDGFALAERMKQQAQRFGVKTVNAQAQKVALTAEPKAVEASTGRFLGRTVILATGANPRHLGLPEEESLVGRGVSYCATCDGAFYRDKTVVVVGGGNTAAEDTLLLSRMARKVILVHRRDTLRATKIYHEPLLHAPNVTIRWNSAVTRILHEDRVTGVELTDTVTGRQDTLACDGVFVSIGRDPATDLLGDGPDLDSHGHIIAGEDTRTSIPGVYAVGDVRTKEVRQVVTAVADGAVAAHRAEAFLRRN